MAATPDGGGYGLTASDATIDNSGDAGFSGSAHGLNLPRPGAAAPAEPARARPSQRPGTRRARHRPGILGTPARRGYRQMRRR